MCLEQMYLARPTEDLGIDSILVLDSIAKTEYLSMVNTSISSMCIHTFSISRLESDELNSKVVIFKPVSN